MVSPLRQQTRAALPLAKRHFRPIKIISATFPSNLERLYHWQEDVENLEAYCSGGYHPVKLGDLFSRGRYEIIHKLGHGSFSTVWLARDSVAEKFVSLKVITANASGHSSEAQVLKSVHQNSLHHPGRTSVSSLLDEFLVEGPNGNHRCLVCEAQDGRKKIEDVTEEYREVKPLALRIKRMRSTPSAAREAEQLNEQDSIGLQKLLERCLRFEPEERATAEDILKMDWIQKLRASVCAC